MIDMRKWFGLGKGVVKTESTLRLKEKARRLCALRQFVGTQGPGGLETVASTIATVGGVPWKDLNTAKQ